MNKHQLLKKAYDKYPKGTVYTWQSDTVPRKVISCGRFYFHKNELYNDWEIHDEEDRDLAVFNGESWAEIVPDKNPLLISVDGVPLYEGDNTFMVYPLEDYKDKVFDFKLHPFHNGIKSPERAKAFSTKQAALEWIEAQKAKYPIINETKKEVVTEIEIEFNEESSVLITKDNLIFSGKDFKLTQLEVMDIFSKFNSLQNA